jgi:dTDP-4-amino-4,6-dideoxygalactose transaminase
MKHITMLDLKLEYEYMKKDIDAAIAKCLDHQKWIFGPEVKELEETLAKYLGVKYCIGASSGTEALVLSLRALAIKVKGQEYFDKTDEIITTPFTFTATGDAILRSGATPVFVDIDPVTFNIDTKKIADYLSSPSGARVVGIIPVHLYGQACDMDEVMSLAGKRNLFVVEDIAQAYGGAWKSRKLGAIGSTGCFSFFPSKNLGGFGDGGMVSTNDDKIAEIIRMLLKHGGKDKYNVDHIGYNARLDTLQAAIVLSKYKYIDEFNRKRQGVAKQYAESLKGLKGITTPQSHADADHVFHQYTLRIADGKRDEFQKQLKDKGIDSMVYYPVPLHKMKVFEGRFKAGSSLAASEQAVQEVVSLPIEPLQNAETTQYVIETIKAKIE